MLLYGRLRPGRHINIATVTGLRDVLPICLLMVSRCYEPHRENPPLAISEIGTIKEFNPDLLYRTVNVTLN